MKSASKLRNGMKEERDREKREKDIQKRERKIYKKERWKERENNREKEINR